MTTKQFGILGLALGWLLASSPMLKGSAVANPTNEHRAFIDTTVTTAEENVDLRITPTGEPGSMPAQSIVMFAPSANTQDVYYSLNAASVSPIGTLNISGVLHPGQSKSFDGRWNNIRYESFSGTQSIEAAAIY